MQTLVLNLERIFDVCPMISVPHLYLWPRHQSSGAVIGRCGQPEVSWWGWRNADDEHLVQAIAKACITDQAAHTAQANGSCVHHHVPGELSDPHTANGSAEAEPKTTPPQKLLILDARSYAAAVANRAKGGGCECPGNAAELTFSNKCYVYKAFHPWSLSQTPSV